ncbi:hypothetical protein PHLCEN_2v11199 [Hermanssonia centrifuga]|uniref:Cytochrome b5 heme-binding domain-containing protein n=1 Tax=Hermanssonia centrifuga TaxID=98765 RepID=A0A2R6NLS4_9APHY|nr:hypothetical protein PHLCEN_2v11199 [Hermanssonia centrifuga]
MSTKSLRTLTREEVAKWIIIDSKVYDVTRFKDLHPGGAAVFLEEETSGQDVTEAFYGLHLHEVLLRPQYQRLQIGLIEGEEPQLHGNLTGEVSKVPYAEPSWLSEGYHSAYFKESHRQLQKATRILVDEIVYPDAQAREQDGKRPSQSVFDRMAEVNLHAMRMGPGKHLQGLSLMNGIVTPEETTATKTEDGKHWIVNGHKKWITNGM